MAAHRSLYSILNVSSDAEPVVIEAAYRALMKKYHPDQGAQRPGAAEINSAFATLRDPERRAEYDRREWNRQQEMLLSQYQPPLAIVRRRIGLFGWTGWAVAAVLSGVMLIAADSSRSVLPAAPGTIRTAAATTPSAAVILRADAPDDILLTPAGIAQIEAEAAEVEAHAAVTARRLEASPGAARSHSTAKPRRPRQPTKRAPASEEREFLERQGYIY
jgi:curved DNA-binding protein CbpA